MLDKSKSIGADIPVNFCGCYLQSPYTLSSDPLCYRAEGMTKGHEASAGAVVTRIIRLGAAINPAYCMGTVNQDSPINCEKQADSDRLNWHKDGILETVAVGAAVIGSMGHALKEAQTTVKDVERAGAHMTELVPCTEDTLIPMLGYAKVHVNIPAICKLPGNWPDTVGAARKCLEHGANGICAIDSIDPMSKIDTGKAVPKIISEDGSSQVIGATMRPITMRYNYQIAKENLQLTNLYVSGGTVKADDAIKHMMTGATSIGVCTVGILKGMEYAEKMCYDLSRRLAELGYGFIRGVSRTAYPNFPSEEYTSSLEFYFTPLRENGVTKRCVNCRKYKIVCCYDTRKLTSLEMTVDTDECRCCGFYLDVCSAGVLTMELVPQTEKDPVLVQKLEDFYELVKQQTLTAATLFDPARESIHIQKGRKRNVNAKRGKDGEIPGPHS